MDLNSYMKPCILHKSNICKQFCLQCSYFECPECEDDHTQNLKPSALDKIMKQLTQDPAKMRELIKNTQIKLKESFEQAVSTLRQSYY